MDVILLAAGIGKRAKLEYPKQLLKLGEKPLLIHTIELLESALEINQFIVSVIPGEKELFENIISTYGYDHCICVEGGNSRQESVYNALSLCTSDRVLIHEAVRPFASKELIGRLILASGQAVIPCVSETSTVFYKDEYLDRNNVQCVQLPQIFDTLSLKKAHESAIGKNYTDDSSLLFYESGILPTIIDGLEENIKITTPIDRKIAEVIYNETSRSSRRE